jgi:hypothetical protein
VGALQDVAMATIHKGVEIHASPHAFVRHVGALHTRLAAGWKATRSS